MDTENGLGPAALAELDALLAAFPELVDCAPARSAAALALVRCWRGGGTLFLCGHGGSHADALHIAGELVKSFERPRPLQPALAAALRREPFGEELAGVLQAGLPAVVLGANASVASAISNDLGVPQAALAQELLALGRAGDALLAISTSGRSRNVLMAVSVARALRITTIALTGTGEAGRQPELAAAADVVVAAPASGTAAVQGWHVRLYHCLCGMVEAELFPPPGSGVTTS